MRLSENTSPERVAFDAAIAELEANREFDAAALHLQRAIAALEGKDEREDREESEAIAKAEREEESAFLSSEQQVKWIAELDGFRLEVFRGDALRRLPAYWRFRGPDGLHVLTWFPEQGTCCYRGATNVKCGDPHQALALARWLIGETDGYVEVELKQAGILT